MGESPSSATGAGTFFGLDVRDRQQAGKCPKDEPVPSGLETVTERPTPRALRPISRRAAPTRSAPSGGPIAPRVAAALIFKPVRDGADSFTPTRLRACAANFAPGLTLS